VQECLLLAGEFDYWIKLRVKDLQAFNRLHANTLLRYRACAVAFILRASTR
jgi:Lrp/AsnC family leucine-responsive transcriptional regulator